MKRLITIISAGIIALLSLNSCSFDFDWVDNSGSMEALLTCRYAGNLPTVTAYQEYQLHDTRIPDKRIEEIFWQLSDAVKAGFIDAVLEIHIYDSRGHFRKTRVFDFWWETNPMTGEGYYAWEEIKE